MSTQAYSKEIDQIIYAQPCRSFNAEQYVELALACLDQAGMSREEQSAVAKRIGIILAAKPLELFSYEAEERASDKFLTQARASR